MSTQNAGPGSTHGGSTSVGVGPGNDRQGAEPGSEGSQRETGGSGGEGMTRSLEDTGSDAFVEVDGDTAGATNGEPLAEGADMTAINRGAQDTRSRQAKAMETGLGAPETGANQGPDDLAPRI